MYKFKQEGTHTPSKFIYEIRRGENEHMVFVNSKTLIVDESGFLDYYADWCDVDREGLKLLYKQVSIELE